MFTILPITGRLLAGRWASRRCEVRSGSLFLTRQLSLQADNSWGAEFHYFSDPDCSRPEFSVSVSGQYIRAGRSGRVPGAANIDFLLTKAAVRPQSQQILSQLNSSTCGLQELWELDDYQDVTAQGGCSELGLTVPSLSLEIIKVELSKQANLELFLGQPRLVVLAPNRQNNVQI